MTLRAPASGPEAVLARLRTHLDEYGEIPERDADALLTIAETAEKYREAADWYRRCLEDLQDRKPVRGLAEAKAGYDSARDALDDARALLDGGQENHT